MKKTILKLMGVIVAASLFIAGCGADKSESAPAKQEEQAQAAEAAGAETPAEVDSGEAAEAPAEENVAEAAAETAGGTGALADGVQEIIYDQNDILITCKEFEEGGNYILMTFDVTNNGTEQRDIYFFDCAVNGLCIPVYGSMVSVAPGSTESTDEMINTGYFDFAGISEAGTIKLGIKITDDDMNLIDQPPLLPVYVKDESASYAMKPSGNVLYSEDGITVTYQGLLTESDDTEVAFLVQNQTGKHLIFTDDSEYSKINGESYTDYRSKYGMSVSTGSVPKDSAEIVTVSIFDSQTYKATDFDTAEVGFWIDYTGSDKRRIVPVQLVPSGDSMDVTAGEPIYEEHVPTDEEKAGMSDQSSETGPESEGAEAAEKTEEAEEAKEPVVADHAIINYTVGTTSNAADIIAIVKNPNEKTAIEGPNLYCVAYDADGKELGRSARFTMLGSLRPGESIPAYGSIHSLDLDTAVDHVEFEFEHLRYWDPDQFQKEQETSEFLSLLTDDIIYDFEVVQKESHIGVGHQYTALTGTLTNNGQTAYDVYVTAVAYNSDGEIIYGGRTNKEDEFAAGDTIETDVELDVPRDEIPEIDHVDVFVFAKYIK